MLYVLPPGDLAEREESRAEPGPFTDEPAPSEAEAEQSAAEWLEQRAMLLVLRVLLRPMKQVELASELDVTQDQVKRWLRELERRGEVRRLRKPLRFEARQTVLPGYEGAALSSETGGDAASELLRAFQAEARHLLWGPRQAVDVAETLGVTKWQAERWLRRWAREGSLTRIAKR